MKISKRIIAVCLTLCMMLPIISLFPCQTVYAANTENSSAPVSAETYSELGFNTMSEDEYPTNERLDRRYSVTNVQNELYVHVNADEHYGTVLRDNLRYFESSAEEVRSAGAIKTYGDKTASLAGEKGNTYSYLDEQINKPTLYSSFTQGTNKMENKAYATSVALRSISGKKLPEPERCGRPSGNTWTDRFIQTGSRFFHLPERQGKEPAVPL